MVDNRTAHASSAPIPAVTATSSVVAPPTNTAGAAAAVSLCSWTVSKPDVSATIDRTAASNATAATSARNVHAPTPTPAVGATEATTTAAVHHADPGPPCVTNVTAAVSVPE